MAPLKISISDVTKLSPIIGNIDIVKIKPANEKALERLFVLPRR